MSATDIKKMLQEQYDRTSWKGFLLEVLSDQHIQLRQYAEEVPLNDRDRNIAQKIARYADIRTSDDKIFPVYEVILQDKTIIERNRVSVNELIKNLIRQRDREGALVTFAYSKDYAKKEWRFSFIAHEEESLFGDEEDEEDLKKTSPKRYTYIFGTHETHRTAIKRFQLLQESNKSLEDFINAFAIEKMSKEFFNKYRAQYGAFIGYLIGKNENDKKVGEPVPYFKTIFKGDEIKARDFVKKMLGRIVFLYFLQRKGWLGVPQNKSYGKGDPNFLANLFAKSKEHQPIFYSQYLDPLFFELLNKERANDSVTIEGFPNIKIPYLNGGLFERDETLPSNTIINFPKSLFQSLFDFFSEYNFTIYENSPDDHTIAVDPEMLGHIFENLLEDNKDKGAFYTPKPIVHYMCQESLIEYLTIHLSKDYAVYRKLGNDQIELFGNEQQTGQLSILEKAGKQSLNRTDVERIIKEKNIHGLDDAQLEQIDDLLDVVKICDPAIGSGAFPMGLLQEIYAIKEVIAYKLGQDWQPATVKENIIQNSIYGVDIEAGAVDIARLRFWLSLIVDEEKPKPLPNLDYKIVVGDSLLPKFKQGNVEEVIRIDWSKKGVNTSAKIYLDNIQNLLKQIVKKQYDYFYPKGNKIQLKAEIRELKIDLLLNQVRLNAAVLDANRVQSGELFAPKKKNKKELEAQQQSMHYQATIKKLEKLQDSDTPFQFFDWKLDFPNILNPQLTQNVGFDIVIGNPPYIQLQVIKEAAAKLDAANFKTFTRTGDIYCIFYEKGNQLLKKRGCLVYITSNKWLKAKYGAKLRAYLSDFFPKRLINLGPNIFENATVETNILILENEKRKNDLKGIAIQTVDDVVRIQHNELVSIKIVNDEKWRILSKVESFIDDRITHKGKLLKDWDLDIYRGILTGFNEAFIIDDINVYNELLHEDLKNKKIVRPVVRGRDVQRFSFMENQSWIINSHNGLSFKLASKDIKQENDIFIMNVILDDKIIVKKAFRVEEESKSKVRLDRVIVENDYPLIYKYLLKHKTRLVPRTDQGKHWSNLRNCAYIEEFKKEKIIWKRIGSIMRFAYSDEEIYCLDSTCIATGEKIKYLTAFLNSKLGLYQLGKTSPKTGTGDNIISVQALEPLHVYYPNDEEENLFATFVDYILHLKKQDADNFEAKLKATYFERIIDGIVYELYFPDLLQKYKRTIIPHLGKLPAFTEGISDAKKNAIIEEVFTRLDDKKHPVRNNLYFMNTIPEIAIIEGT